MNARRTGPGRRDNSGAAKGQRPESGPARRSTRPPQGGAIGEAIGEAFDGAIRGAVEGKMSRPGSRLPSKADGGPAPGALRPLARALIELAVALRRDEDEKGATG